MSPKPLTGRSTTDKAIPIPHGVLFDWVDLPSEQETQETPFTEESEGVWAYHVNVDPRNSPSAANWLLPTSFDPIKPEEHFRNPSRVSLVSYPGVLYSNPSDGVDDLNSSCKSNYDGVMSCFRSTTDVLTGSSGGIVTYQPSTNSPRAFAVGVLHAAETKDGPNGWSGTNHREETLGNAGTYSTNLGAFQDGVSPSLAPPKESELLAQATGTAVTVCVGEDCSTDPQMTLFSCNEALPGLATMAVGLVGAPAPTNTTTMRISAPSDIKGVGSLGLVCSPWLKEEFYTDRWGFLKIIGQKKTSNSTPYFQSKQGLIEFLRSSFLLWYAPEYNALLSSNPDHKPLTIPSSLPMKLCPTPSVLVGLVVSQTPTKDAILSVDEVICREPGTSVDEGLSRHPLADTAGPFTQYIGRPGFNTNPALQVEMVCPPGGVMNGIKTLPTTSGAVRKLAIQCDGRYF